MKKFISICLALIMVFAMSITAAADTFLESPSNLGAPVIEEFQNEDPDCIANLNIIPYKDRGTLTDSELADFENGYNSIHDASDLSDVCAGLKDVANSHNIYTSDMSVSDLFYINYKDCVKHDEHGAFKIKLSADTLKGFVSLIQFIDGKWVIVDGAKVEGGYLIFKADELGTFAVVVDATKGVATSPQTGDPTSYILASVAAVATIAFVAAGVVIIRKRKA